MTNDIDTSILGNTLKGTPFDWYIVLYVLRVRENGIVARSTTTLKFLGRIIVDTE